jgi:tetratricopeptide (TPR) repeat protein
MLPFDPFAWFYSFVGYLQELWERLALLRRIQQTSLYQKAFGFLLNVSIVPERKSSGPDGIPEEEDGRGRLGEFFQLLIHASFVQPLYWLIALLGLSFEWVISRRWLAIGLLSLPSVMLLGLVVATWLGGRLDRRQLATHYLELAIQELDFQKNTPDSRSPAATSSPQDVWVPEAVSQAVADQETQERPYVELLVTRSQLLNPINVWRYWLGANTLDRGGYRIGRKLLQRLAPDDAQGMPHAHAAIATSYLNEWNRNQDPALVAPFVHHAEASLAWPGTPKEVLLELSSVRSQQGSPEGSLQVLKTAAERFPGLYLTLVEQAAALGNQQMVTENKSKAIQEAEAALKLDPANAKLRVRLVRMYDTDQSGLVRIESVIKEGLEIRSDPLLTRALSEVYRIAFVRGLLETGEAQVDIGLLDTALQVDPSNPLVADQIGKLIQNRQGPLDDLSDALIKILASGNATIGTHAILAELRLKEGNTAASLHHLEQVYQAAPQAAKYTNQLVQIYQSQGRLEEAVNVGVNALSILDKNGLLKEVFVDELLHSMGLLFFRLGRSDDALSALENALISNPKRVDTRTELAKYYRSVGKDRQAEAHEQALTELSNSSDRGRLTPSVP